METIAAIATAMTPAGISIVRISGPEAISIADRIFVPSKGEKKSLQEEKSHTIHYGLIMDQDQVIDEVLLLLMKKPNSYTAEDTVEIDCHGGVLVTKKVLQTVLKNGARPADPGEFTKRAFLNGRIDLSRAEAVADLIQSENDFAMKSSVAQLEGAVERQVKQFRDEILDSVAFIEAALDDPEHLSVDGYGKELKEKILPMKDKIDEMIDRSEEGKVLSEGIETVLVGKPNVGKSSVLNLLCGSDQAIVTEVAGTTRDAIRQTVQFNGISFHLTDTAGIRKAGELVEQIGVDHTKKYIKEADLVLLVCDTSIPLDDNDEKIFPFLAGKNVITVLNKTDLPKVVTEEELKERGITGPFVALSALIGEGKEDLIKTMTDLYQIGEISFNDEIFLTNERQKQAMIRTRDSLSLVLSAIDEGISEDFYTIDLMDAYSSLGEIIGEKVDDDLIDRIFSKFCVGK